MPGHVILATGHGVAGPFDLFATWAHEVSHAIVGVVFGASIRRIDLALDGSGVTHVSTTGQPSDTLEVAVGSAGYLGSVVWGALLMVAGRWGQGARAALGVVGACMVLSALLWMPSAFSFGLSAGVGALFVALAFALPERTARFLATALGALTLIEGLLRLTDVGDRTTDAVMTSHFAGVGVGTVRLLWIVVAVLVAIGVLVVRTAPFRHAADELARGERANESTRGAATP